jgi:hypothetical protein
MWPDENRLILAVLGYAPLESLKGVVLEGVSRAVRGEPIANPDRIEQDVGSSICPQPLKLSA